MVMVAHHMNCSIVIIAYLCQYVRGVNAGFVRSELGHYTIYVVSFVHGEFLGHILVEHYSTWVTNPHPPHLLPRLFPALKEIYPTYLLYMIHEKPGENMLCVT